MSSVGYLPRQSGGIVRTALDSWRGITRVHVNGALLFGCAVFGYHFIVFSKWIFTQSAHPILSMGKGLFIDQLAAFILMLALVATDRITDGDARRRGAYAVAVVVTATLYTPLRALFEQLGDPEFVWIDFVNAALYTFFEWVVLAGVATFIYTDRQRARAALARRRAAELERACTAKRALESRLQAMQARVEPRFLFNTLAQVRGLYRANATLGERMLEELIAYLRAAMPKMRDTSSTLAQEIELVRSYLAIVKLRLGDCLSVHIDVPEGLRDARMPPMVLLPLVDLALAQRPEGPAQSVSIGIVAVVQDERLRLTLADSWAGFVVGGAGRDGIASIRERLSALYGDAASLALQEHAAGRAQAVLHIPHEPVEAPRPSAA